MSIATMRKLIKALTNLGTVLFLGGLILRFPWFILPGIAARLGAVVLGYVYLRCPHCGAPGGKNAICKNCGNYMD